MQQSQLLRKLVKRMKIKHHIIPIFVPHVGCPHDCVFCNQKKITGISTDITSEEVDNTIKSYLETIPESNQELEVAFYGGSFTAIDRDIQKELLGVANEYKTKGLIDRIRLSTRPDCIDKDGLKLLKSHGVDIIELGVQSLNQEVLDKSNRGHSKKDVYDAVKLIRESNFTLGLQMMLGLPGDTEERSIYTAKEIIKLKPDFVRIYPTLIVKDTYLETLYFEKKYKSLSVEQAVDIASIILMLFELEDINVIRIGLQPTENICSESGEVVGGPFHPSFRQLVESKIYGLILDEFLEENKIKGPDIKIDVNKKEISNIVGQKSSNIKMIRDKCDLRKVIVNGTDMDRMHVCITDDLIENRIEKRAYIEKYLKNNKYLS